MRAKALSFILASTITIGIAITGVGLVAASMYQTVHMAVSDGNGKTVEVEFPLAPRKIACLNYDSVDILDKLGMGDRIVGMIKGENTPKHLQKYNDDSRIVDLGGMKNPNMEALAALQPDVILSSGRTGKLYDEFAKIAPTMMVAVDAKDGFFKGVKDLAMKHGILMDKEKDVAKFLVALETKAERLRTKNSGKRAIQAIFVGEKLHILGAQAADGKGGGKILISDLGFENAGRAFDRTNKEADSYSYILEQNPEFVFVLDKNTAVNNPAPKAKEVILKNEKLMQSEAFKNSKIIFLNPETTWYVNSGGLTAMEYMLKNF